MIGIGGVGRVVRATTSGQILYGSMDETGLPFYPCRRSARRWCGFYEAAAETVADILPPFSGDRARPARATPQERTRALRESCQAAATCRSDT